MIRMSMALAATMALAGPAFAQAPRSLDADIACMLAATHAVEEGKGARLRNFAGAMKVFYMGRVDARLAEEALAARIAEQARRMAQTPPVEDLKLCSSYFMDQAGKVAAAGKQAPPAPKK